MQPLQVSMISNIAVDIHHIRSFTTALYCYLNRSTNGQANGSSDLIQCVDESTTESLIFGRQI